MKNLKRFPSLKNKDLNSKEQPLLSATTNFSQDNLNAYGSATKVNISNKHNRQLRLLSNESDRQLTNMSQSDSLQCVQFKKSASRNNEYDFNKNNQHLKQLGMFSSNRNVKHGNVLQSKFQSNQFTDQRKQTQLYSVANIKTISHNNNSNRLFSETTRSRKRNNLMNTSSNLPQNTEGLIALEKYRSLNPTSMESHTQNQTFTHIENIRTNAGTSMEIGNGARRYDQVTDEQEQAGTQLHTPLNFGKIDRPKTAKARGMVANPSILGSSLGAFEAMAGSRKDHMGFNINISAQSSYHQTQKIHNTKPRGPVRANHLATNTNNTHTSSYHRIIPKQAATIQHSSNSANLRMSIQSDSSQSSMLLNKTVPNLAGISQQQQSRLQKRIGRAPQTITTDSKYLHRVKIIEVHEVDEEIAMAKQISETMVPKHQVKLRSNRPSKTPKRRPMSAKRLNIKTGNEIMPEAPAQVGLQKTLKSGESSYPNTTKHQQSVPSSPSVNLSKRQSLKERKLSLSKSLTQAVNPPSLSLQEILQTKETTLKNHFDFENSSTESVEKAQCRIKSPTSQSMCAQVGLSHLTKDINKNMEQHMATLTSVHDEVVMRQHLPPGVNYNSFLNNKMMKQNCDEQLTNAQKQIKVMKFECQNIIADESQKFINIEAPGMHDANSRGPETKVDIIQNCKIVLKIDVKGRKVPLKLNFSYECKDQRHKGFVRQGTKQSEDLGATFTRTQTLQSLDASPLSPTKQKSSLAPNSHLHRQVQNNTDLSVYCTDESSEPNAVNSKQTWFNPGSKIIIKKLDQMQPISQNTTVTDTIVDDKFDRNRKRIDETTFSCKTIFVTLASEAGQSNIGISCSFPNQAEQEIRVFGINKRYQDNTEQQTTGAQPEICHANQIPAKVEELAVNSIGKQELEKSLIMLKARRIRAGLKNCDIDFINLNVDSIQLMDVIKEKKQIDLGMIDYKIQQAQQRKQQLQDKNKEKNLFEMLKWDLYRNKCEQIEEDYAAFKKMQKKINWWMQFIMRQRMLNMIKEKFIIQRDFRYKQTRDNIMRVRIKQAFRRYIKKKGFWKGDEQYSRDIRNHLPIRNGLTFYMMTKGGHQEAQAKWIVKDQLYICLEYLQMKHKFDVYFEKIENIKRQFKARLSIRAFRLNLLDQMFDREKKIMQNYYQEKMKKNKKLKTTYTQFCAMNPHYKDLVLSIYATNKLQSENQTKALYSLAQLYVKRGEIVDLKTGQYQIREDQMLTEHEVATLKHLKSNIHYADAFLWKGVKMTKTVGELEDIYTLENSPKRCKHSVEKEGDGILNIKTLKGTNKTKNKDLTKQDGKEEGSGSDGEGDDNNNNDNKSTKQSANQFSIKETIITNQVMTKKGISVTIPVKTEKASKKGGKAGKTASKSKEKGKGKSKASSPSIEKSATIKRAETTLSAPSMSKEKKSKKKKVKLIEFEVPLEIPTEPQGVISFLPDRLTMQKLVTRACILKEKEIEPVIYTETRPWVKQDKMNMDMEIPQTQRTDCKDKIHEWFYNQHVLKQNQKNQAHNQDLEENVLNSFVTQQN